MATAPRSPLPTFGDRTVSRFRARDEARDTLAAAMAASTVLAPAARRVLKARASLNGKFTAREILGLSSLFVESYDKVANVVLGEDHARDASRVRPNATERSHLRIHALRGDASTVWLTSARLQLSRRFASYETSRNEFSWYMHAQERLHERHGDVGRADTAIAKAILDNLATLRVATTIRESRALPDRLAVPCMGGLLCGAFVAVGPSDFHGECIRVDKSRYTEGRVVPMSVISGNDVAWRAWTYVGPKHLFPDQRRYVERWEDMRAGLSDVNALCMDSFSTVTLAEGPVPGDDDRKERLMAAFGPAGFGGAASALAAFLKDPEMARAAGTLPEGSPLGPLDAKRLS